MSEEKQTILEGNEAEAAFDNLEANMEKEKAENSPYFKPIKDKTMTVTFSGWEIGEKEFAKKDVNNNEILVDGNKVMEKKQCLLFWVDTLDGKDISTEGPAGGRHPGKEWTVTSKSLIATMRLYCTGGNILKKKFQIRRTGEKYQTKYAVAEAGEKE